MGMGMRGGDMGGAGVCMAAGCEARRHGHQHRIWGTSMKEGIGQGTRGGAVVTSAWQWGVGHEGMDTRHRKLGTGMNAGMGMSMAVACGAWHGAWWHGLGQMRGQSGFLGEWPMCCSTLYVLPHPRSSAKS